jgi:acetoin utilization protein AcuC
MKIGIIYHEDFKKYDFGPGHPLRGKYAMDSNIAFSLVNNNEMLNKKAQFDFIKPHTATEEDILTVHTKEYIDFIKNLNEKGGFVTLDTPVLKGMYEIVKLFAGADMLAGRLVMEKTLNKSFVFGMMGHHAGADFGGGFCLINDIAVMIESMRKNYDLKKILVFDYTANNGHGTESIFYETPEVMCVDIHQDPLTLYPGTGFPEQVGRGEGKGYTVNIPLPPYTSDKDYLFALNEIVVPIVYEYKPEIIVLAGLNGCHFTVEINQLMLSLKGLYESVRLLSKLADAVCEGRFVHIGGWSLNMRLLPLGFLATIAGALDVEIELPEPYNMPENVPNVAKHVEKTVQTVKSVHKKYWKFLTG